MRSERYKIKLITVGWIIYSHTMQNKCRENLCEQPHNCKSHESYKSFLPRNFPTIWYMYQDISSRTDLKVTAISAQQHRLQLTSQLIIPLTRQNLEWKLWVQQHLLYFTHLWQSEFHSLAVDDHLLGRVSHFLLYESQQVLLIHTRGGVNVSVHLQGGSEDKRAHV